MKRGRQRTGTSIGQPAGKSGTHHSNPPRGKQRRPGTGAGTYWAHGRHAVLAGLLNRNRPIGRVLATANALPTIAQAAEMRGINPETVDRAAIDRLLGEDAVHQGLAAQFHPLPTPSLEDIIDTAPSDATIMVLDQITDPHNVGAILRTAAVFGAGAVILQDRNTPPEGAVLAKSASGALENVPLVRIGNLANALDKLREAGFWCIGLAGEAQQNLAAANIEGRLAIVLGAEGDGLRRLTRERCDILVHIPMAPNAVGSLNVSNAAAVALYAATVERRNSLD